MTQKLFDFVTDDTLRESLESDYSELCACLDGKAWKMAHVAAGSIVEALLIDWLGANGVTGHNGKDLLKMDLGVAIEACESNNLISSRAINLTTVIREYRNLIHPGRLIRTKAKADKSGAEVAKALVEMIVQEVAELKANKYGYTAEQIVNKVVNDPSSISFIAHLIREAKDVEKERLLLRAIPRMYTELATVGLDEGVQPTKTVLLSLTKCFREVFRQAHDDTKRKAVANYLTLLKTSADFKRRTYEEAFFVAADLQWCGAAEIELIVDHLLSRLSETNDSLKMYVGIGKYLTEENWQRFVDMLRPDSWSPHNSACSTWTHLELLRDELHYHMTGTIKCKALAHLKQLHRVQVEIDAENETARLLKCVISCDFIGPF